MNWFKSVAIAIDQLLNALAGGMPDETLSSVCYRRRHQHKFFWFCHELINLIFFWQDEHCYNAYLSEVERKHINTTIY